MASVKTWNYPSETPELLRHYASITPLLAVLLAVKQLQNQRLKKENHYSISVSFPHGERLHHWSKFRHTLSQRLNFIILGFCICYQFLIQPFDGRQCHPGFVNRADGLLAVAQSTSGEKPMTWRNGGTWCNFQNNGFKTTLPLASGKSMM